MIELMFTNSCYIACTVCFFFFLRFAFCFCLQDIQEHHGKTAVDLARENGHKRVVEFITNFKPQLKCELFIIY